ncbi:MAG TPA: hypothetical protein PJ982_00945 [Lacipirellulaceae bacterium]|nr:hypothetical protein [Lacipirellulaceae bacterium]
MPPAPANDAIDAALPSADTAALLAEDPSPAETAPLQPPAAPPPWAPLSALPPSRFWNETVRALGLYLRRRGDDDYANALSCFEKMSRHRYWEMCQRPEFNRALPSVVSVFQPKSGGTYLHNRMQQLGYCDYWWFFTHRTCPSHCFASVEALKLFMLGGCTAHTHARPEPNILSALDAARVPKIWVHLRNPAECALSGYYHYRGEGHGAGHVGQQRRDRALGDAARQGLAPGVEASEIVVEHIPWHIEWVAQWLRFAQQHPGLVVFSYHPELVDPQAMLRRVFGELGVELSGEIDAAPNDRDRFRTKRSADWRSELTSEARSYVERRVKAELRQFPELLRFWT